MRLGQRGIAWLSPGFHVASYIINAIHPPYPVLVVSFVFAGVGNGLADSAWNAWVANLANANELLGFLHGFYGLGATLSPLIATALITKANLPWYCFYYIMIGGSAIELVASIASFWKANGHEFRTTNARSTNRSKESHMKEALFSQEASRVTWLCAAFLLGYVGVEVALGGWIVTFMIRVREGAPFASGITATGFWIGITVGRVVLGFITPRIGEKLAISVSRTLSKGGRKGNATILGMENTLFIPTLILSVHADLPPPRHGPRTHLLAGPSILRFHRRHRPARLLPRAHVPRGRGRRDQTPPKTSPCLLDRLRCGVGRGRRGSLPFCCGCSRTGEGSAGPAAFYTGAVGSDSVCLVGVAGDVERP
ncbi:hypothetical protein VTN77DRAFT_4222 [Rasamsonia byssochlamydoides]|uniref:uncharacterized protein n=1 Tax=Rasamsonia byssochlamydoides TaxID=89139 RepID=UPI003744AF4B